MNGKMIKLTFAAVVAAVAGAAVAVVAPVESGNLEIVRGDVLKDNPEAETLDYAAQELSRWIGEITGRYVPVRDPRAELTAPNRIVVGVNAAKALFPEDLKAIGASDGFAVRTLVTNGVTSVYVFGSCARGVQNGVYRLLERNTDILWARPHPKFGTVFSRRPSIEFRETDFREVPVSRFRHWQWGGSYGRSEYHHQIEWEARNLMNAMTFAPAKYAPMMTRAGKGHQFIRYAKPKENLERHPEWFTLYRGERTAKTGWLCFSAGDDLVDEFVKNMCAELEAAYPGVKPKALSLDYFNLSGADNWEVCECEKCTAPFTCPNGKVVSPEDPAFRSAQCFAFLNRIAAKFSKRYPKVTLGQYAYYITTAPPPFKLAKNLRIQFCPYGEDMKRPISDPVNDRWLRDLDGWGKVCPKLCYRSYFGCNDSFPRQLEDVVKTNCLYCLSRPMPITEFMTEQGHDGYYAEKCGESVTWDMSAMQNWIVCRLWWNPYADLEELRADYLRRAYREAAEPMAKVHGLLRDAFRSDSMSSVFNAVSSVPYTRHYLLDAGRDGELMRLLDEAEAKAVHPVSQELIRRMKARFASWIAEAKTRTVTRFEVPYSSAEDLATSFDSAVWDAAAATKPFVIASRKAGQAGGVAQTKTMAKLLHDRRNFYVRIDCGASDMATLPVSSLRPAQKSASPRGDTVELYFGRGDTGVYSVMIFDAGNPEAPEKDCLYTAKMSDTAWPCPWTRRVKRYDDRWTAIVTVPFDSIGVTAAQTGTILFQALRDKYLNPAAIDADRCKLGVDREWSSVNGGAQHDIQCFCELVVK